jgi:pimeloyl-ACP methyl ester carboxylesterase
LVSAKMDPHDQPEKVKVPTGRVRQFFNLFFRFIILACGLTLLGSIYESYSEYNDKRRYLHPGRLINVGGYRLHINCKGNGSPTVVIEAGWGDSSASWGWVQPEIAKITRICTYDRAGMGWSEASPHPRTAREFAKELHTLLDNAYEPRPYVLVGHSLGGYTMRVFAHDYFAEVVGLVLVDAQALPKSNVTYFKAVSKTSASSFPALLARIGVMRLLAGPLGAVQDLPEEDRGAYTAFAVTPRFVQTFLDEGRGMSEGGAQAKAVTNLGVLPLIVLSRGKDQDLEWAASQSGFLKLSTNSLQLFADRSGHRIMIEQPEAAIASILKMVDLVRRQPH